MRVRTVCFLILGLVLAASRFAGATDGFMTVEGRRFVDHEGRHVVLHGFDNAHTFEKMREWGMNCGRLLMNWSYIEPECGVYDENYLAEVDARVAAARANGVYIVLDMHQNLWGEGVPHGSGAPEWALLDKEQPHLSLGPVWGAAYFQSPRIQIAFDNFWANKPGPDGVGIQDRFALVWQHVAKRYANEPAVIGFDIINEPFHGTPTMNAMVPMTMKIAQRMAAKGVDIASMELIQLGIAARDEARKDIESYREWLVAGDEVIKQLDRTQLCPMYNRVAKAIREADRHHIIFTEPSVMAGFGSATGIEPVIDENGNRDPLYAFAPHAYEDDVERMKLVIERLLDAAECMKVPMLLGEWGNLGNEDKIFSEDPLPSGRVTLRMIEESLSGETYHCFRTNVDQTRYFKEIVLRPYPAAVAGVIASYRFDRSTATFECTWKEDPAITAPSRVFIPALWFPDGYRVELEPRGEGWSFEPAVEGSASGCLVIPPTGYEVERKLEVRPRQPGQ